MPNPIISVIIPIYKVEKYLVRCVESILNQTYKNLEIILVDDGSPDNCGEMCDNLALQDNRIKVIHKQNGGLSDARNAGIAASSGELLTFIDSDDYIAPDMIKHLFYLMQKHSADISCCAAVLVGDRDTPQYLDASCEQSSNSESALAQLIYRRNILVNAWGKLYKRELFENILYPVGLLYEDLATTYKLFAAAEKVAWSNAKKYAYVQRDGSIMNKTGYFVKVDKINIVSEMLDFLRSRGITDSTIRSGIYSYLLNDIYKMASLGNLCKNGEYLQSYRKFYLAEQKAIKTSALGAKDRAVLFAAYKAPKVLELLYFNLRKILRV